MLAILADRVTKEQFAVRSTGLKAQRGKVTARIMTWYGFENP